MRLIDYKYLTINGADVNTLSIASSGTAYNTGPIPVQRNNGYSALVCTSFAGTALINVSFQLSLDGQRWYNATTSDGTALTSVAAIASSVTANQWIVFNPRPANWMRFNVTATSTGTWSLQYLQQEDGS